MTATTPVQRWTLQKPREAMVWDGTAESSAQIEQWAASHNIDVRIVYSPARLHSEACRCDGRGILPSPVGSKETIRCDATEPTGARPPRLLGVGLFGGGVHEAPVAVVLDGDKFRAVPVEEFYQDWVPVGLAVPEPNWRTTVRLLDQDVDLVDRIWAVLEHATPGPWVAEWEPCGREYGAHWEGCNGRQTDIADPYGLDGGCYRTGFCIPSCTDDGTTPTRYPDGIYEFRDADLDLIQVAPALLAEAYDEIRALREAVL